MVNKYNHNGKSKSIYRISQETGLNYFKLKKLIEMEGYSVDEAINSIHKKKIEKAEAFVLFKESKYENLSVLATEIDVPYNLLYNYVSKGMSPDAAVELINNGGLQVNCYHKGNLYDYEGEVYTS